MLTTAAGPSSSTEMTIQDKALEMKDLSNSLVVAKKILWLMESSNVTMVHPWVDDIQKQIVTIESLTENYLLTLADHMPDHVQPKASSHDRRLTEFEVDTMNPGSFPSDTEGNFDTDYHEKTYKYEDASGFDWKKASNLGGNKHGFGSKKEYRNWRSKSIKTNPHMKHFFNTLDDLEAENFDAVHERMRDVQRDLHLKLSGDTSGGSNSRRLNIELIGNQVSVVALVWYSCRDLIRAKFLTSSSRFWLELKCRLLVSCAKVSKTGGTEIISESCVVSQI